MKSILLVPIFLTIPIYAKPTCENLESPHEILACIVENDSTTKLGYAQMNESILGIEVAAQQPNPSFEMEGAGSSLESYTSEFSLLHTIELGDKRSARMDVAEREKDLLEINLLTQKDQLTIRTVADLYRLRQIGHELELLEEIIHTFREIKSQYAKAGGLEPEEKISVSIFSMSLEESKLRKISLINEKQAIHARIEAGLGKSLFLTRKHLPQIKKEWPDIQLAELSGAQIRRAEKDLALANAHLRLSEANSWPDLSIGPKIEFEKNQSSEIRYGIGLSVPIPLFHSNQGGRSKSLAGVRKSEVELSNVKLRLQRRRTYLHEVYQRVSRTIASSVSKWKVGLKHKNLHNMVSRGVISAPAVVELHRQIMDYFNELHKQEIEGVLAYWQIAAIEGRVSKEVLK